MYSKIELKVIIGMIKFSLLNKKITKWEKKFLKNITEQIIEKKTAIIFSKNQILKLNEIFNKTNAVSKTNEELLKFV